MALYEVELRGTEKREVLVSDRRLTLGETLDIEGELWRVRSVKRPSCNSDAELRYVCVAASPCLQHRCESGGTPRDGRG